MNPKSSLANSTGDEISMRRRGQDEREGEGDPILTELPVGFKFLPTEEELFAFFLKNKIMSLPLPHTAIQDIDSKDLYRQPPSKLVIVSSSDDREWYFFTCYDKNLNETNTRTVGDGLGFWKKENKDGIPIPIVDEPNLCATKNYWTYFNVKEDKKVKKSHWQIEEYHLHIQCSKEGNPNLREEECVLVKLKRGGSYQSSFY